MNKQKKVLFSIIAITVGIILTASVTLLILKTVNSGSNTNPQDNTKSSEDQSEQKAVSLENEANKLIESDPAKAKEKYLEAEKAYTDAANPLKAAEMGLNATTAEANIPQEVTVEEPQPLPTGGQ